MKKQHSLWVEKYRPKTLAEYVCEESLKAKFQSYIDKNDIPHLIFGGSAGVGKTTLAKILVTNIKCDYIYLNASDFNGIDTVRDTVTGFAEAASFEPLKVIILDEADYFTGPAQAALRNLIEENSAKTRFILTCNYIDRIIEPLQSRCVVYKLTPPSKGEVAEHISSVLDKENIEYELKQLVPLINSYYPDIRSILKYTQESCNESKFEYVLTNESWQKRLMALLSTRTKSTWSDIRQLIVNETIDDYAPCYRAMFDSVETWAAGHEAEIIIEIDEYLWRSNACPDKEITFSACIGKILEILK